MPVAGRLAHSEPLMVLIVLMVVMVLRILNLRFGAGLGTPPLDSLHLGMVCFQQRQHCFWLVPSFAHSGGGGTSHI